MAASFIDARTGWVLQSRDTDHTLRTLHTADGGATWTPEAVPVAAIVVALQFIDAQHGWIAGLGGGEDCWSVLHPICSEVLLRTNDGGATWTAAPLARGNFTAMRFTDTREGWAMAFNGRGPCNDNPNVVLHTDDGGATWLQGVVDDEPMGGSAGILLPASGRTAWVFNPLDAKRTTDAGEAWTNVNNPCPPTTEVVLTFHLVSAGSALDDRTAWVVCAAGAAATGQTVFQTRDGGVTWAALSASRLPEPTPSVGRPAPPAAPVMIRFFDALHGVLAGGAPLILERTRDGGKTWDRASIPQPQSTPYEPSLPQFVSPSLGWLVDDTHVWITDDGGTGWTSLALP